MDADHTSPDTTPDSESRKMNRNDMNSRNKKLLHHNFTPTPNDAADIKVYELSRKRFPILVLMGLVMFHFMIHYLSISKKQPFLFPTTVGVVVLTADFSAWAGHCVQVTWSPSANQRPVPWLLPTNERLGTVSGINSRKIPGRDVRPSSSSNSLFIPSSSHDDA